MGTKQKNLCPRPRAARSVVFSSLTHAVGEVRAHASAATHKTHANPFTAHPQSSLFTAHHPHRSSREVFRPTFAPQPLCSPLRVRAYPPARPTIPIPKPIQAGARTKRKHKLKVLGTDPHRTPQTEKQQYSTLRLDKPLTIHPRSLRYARAGPNGQRSSLLLPLPSFFPSASASARLSQSLGPRASIFN